MACSSSKASFSAPSTCPVKMGTDVPRKGKGKGKGKGHGKGRGQADSGSRWQIVLEGKWQDYEQQEDAILRRAYMTGQQNAKFCVRGQSYEYNFEKMIQKNEDSRKVRSIRPPIGWRAPRKPLLPRGPVIIITVGTGQPGSVITVKDPNNPGQTVQVHVPAHAKPGQKMAVPIPGKGESVAEVQKKQKKHDEEHGTKTSGWSTAGKVAAGGAVVTGLAAVGVGGVILGDHLAGGDMAETMGEAMVDAGDAVGDWAEGAAEDVGAWAEGAAEDVGEWAEGAAEDIADFAVDAAEWLEDAGEDVGDFVMDLF